MANIDLKIETLIAEMRNITKLMTTSETTDKDIEKATSQILKAYPLLSEADLIKEERRLSTDILYKNNLASISSVHKASNCKFNSNPKEPFCKRLIIKSIWFFSTI